MRQSLNIFLEHPVIGNGPGSFSLKGIWGNAENYYNGLVSEGKLSLDSRYDPGIITTVLADTGIIGAVFFLLFLFTFFKYNIDVVQKIDGYYQGVSMGLLIGIIGLFSSYILSTGLWMPFIWVFLGFNIASLNLGITEKEEAGIESTDAKQNQPA
jgi:O-antigen ligase